MRALELCHEVPYLSNLPEVVDDGQSHEEGVVGSPGDEAAHPHHQVHATLKNYN